MHKKDFNLLLKTIRENASGFYKLFKKRMSKSNKYGYQSFILKKELFFQYCEFLFGILNILDKKINTSDYSINGQRTLGYLGEILFDSYMYNLTKNSTVKYKELGMTFICADSVPCPVKKRTAIVLLASSEYEFLEISLSHYSKFFNNETKLFILQNGRMTEDRERTFRVALKYESLFPNNIKVMDFYSTQKSYYAIRELLNDKELAEFDYICKVNGDSFPSAPDWLDELCECYDYYFSRYGNYLAFVGPMINTNSFKETASSLHDDIEIKNMKCSTCCILFKKTYWNEIIKIHTAFAADGEEYLNYQFCKIYNKTIIIRQSIPFTLCQRLTYPTRETKDQLVSCTRKPYFNKIKVRSKKEIINPWINLFFPRRSKRRYIFMWLFYKVKAISILF